VDQLTASDLRQVRSLVRLVAGRWPVLVIGALAGHARRREDLPDAIGSGITSGILTAVLRRRRRGSLVELSVDKQEGRVARR
jgi:DNA-binding HxlR family transcriptional regulator